MEKKAVFFDVDGTILDQKIGIPDSAVKAIRKLRENGHAAIICTGRSKASLENEVLAIGFDGYIAGAGTYVEYNNEITWQYLIEGEQLQRLQELLNRLRIPYIMEGPECMYYNPEVKEDFYVRMVQGGLGRMRMEPFGERECVVNKFSCFSMEKEQQEMLFSELRPEYDMIVHDNMPFSEVLPKGVSKATGIERLIRHIGVSRKDTYAFGDSNNDLEMLEYVEYGTAMGNANQNVMKLAKYKTKRLEEDGIWHGLKMFELI